jgi:hypothetical protein
MMDNNNMFKSTEEPIKVKSHRDGESYTLKELLVRIEDLEEKQLDIRYFLANPSKLTY